MQNLAQDTDSFFLVLISMAERPKSKTVLLVPSVAQASKILLFLAQNQSGKTTLTGICRHVAVHKSQAHSILNTLRHFGLIEKDPERKTYSLGAGLLFLSSKVLQQLDLRVAAAPFLRKLSRKTNSTAFFFIRVDRHVYTVAKDEGAQDIGITIRQGNRFPLTWGAHGKVFLAFLPETDKETILSSGDLYVHGGPSSFDPVRLEKELDGCRRTGYAVDLGEMKTGIHAAASPVFGPSGKLIGSIVIMGTFPKPLAARYGLETAKIARGFSKALGCPVDSKRERGALS
jgi:DNA-binding IclR family transcriptional regulator